MDGYYRTHLHGKQAGPPGWTSFLQMEFRRFVDSTRSHGVRDAWTVIARCCIAAFYMNLTFTECEVWWRLRGQAVQPRGGSVSSAFSRQPASPSLPYVELFTVLPAALAVACGWQLLLASAVLLVYGILLDEPVLLWNSISNWLFHGAYLTEFPAKRLAMVGCAAVVLSSALKDARRRGSSFAGLLVSDEPDRQPTAWKSGVLMITRLMMFVLFVYLGRSQFRRLSARNMALTVPHDAAHHWGIRDGHDNNWVLLELLIATPFVLGWKTTVACRVLAGVLVLEAIHCWPFWAGQWPSWSYGAHVREHFFTNLALCGGLMLLDQEGAGRFTVDRLLHARKKQ